MAFRIVKTKSAVKQPVVVFVLPAHVINEDNFDYLHATLNLYLFWLKLLSFVKVFQISVGVGGRRGGATL